MPTPHDPLLVPVHQMVMHRMDSGIGPYGFSDLRIPVPAGSQLETYRRIGVSAFAKHHQLRRDLLVIIRAEKQSYFPRRRYANTPTRRHASPAARVDIKLE